MLIFVVRRLLATIPVLAMVAVFVFLMLRLTPSDPAAILAGDNATTEQVAQIRGKLGLDQPLLVQFGIWSGRLLHGDLGESFFFKKTVAELIQQRLEPTLSLSLVTILLSVLVAVPLGVLAAYRHGSWVDRLVMALSVFGFSVPVFVIGYLLIYVFAIELGWLPVQGFRSITTGLWPFLERLILPASTLSVIYVALIARITRASMLEVMNEDYIRTARAKGLSPGRVIGLHALRNAMIPVITTIGLQVGTLLAGAILTESIFSWPGIGKWMVDAIFRRDYPTVQGGLLLIALLVMLVNLIVDLLYGLINPRISQT